MVQSQNADSTEVASHYIALETQEVSELEGLWASGSLSISFPNMEVETQRGGVTQLESRKQSPDESPSSLLPSSLLFTLINLFPPIILIEKEKCQFAT